MPQDLTDDKSTLGQVMSDKLVLSGNKPLPEHYWPAQGHNELIMDSDPCVLCCVVSCWRGIVVTVRAGGRAAAKLADPYLCNRLMDFLHSKFCGIV